MYEKEKLKEKYIRMYLEGLGVTEYEVLVNDEKLFRDIVKAFGGWTKFQRELGMLNRHIRERDKFHIYWTMKERKIRFGKEALRHKNIEEMLKSRIQSLFGTVNYLTNDLITERKGEALFYEVHALIISGADPRELKEYDIELYAAIIKNYDNEINFFEEYEKLFLINPLEVFLVDKDKEYVVDPIKLLKMGYLSKKDLAEIGEHIELVKRGKRESKEIKSR